MFFSDINSWNLEKAGVSRLQDLKNQIETLLTQLAQYERDMDLDNMAKIKYGSLPALRKELEEEEARYEQQEGNQAVSLVFYPRLLKRSMLRM